MDSRQIFMPLIADVKVACPLPEAPAEQAASSIMAASGKSEHGFRHDSSRKNSFGGIFRLKTSDSHLRVLHSLPKCLTFWDLIPLGVGATIGAGVYVLIGTVAKNNAGPSLPISFLCAGAAAALSAFCYAELASRCPSAGSAYHYAYTTVGEIVAWLIGWALILEYTVGGAAVARGISPNLATVFGGPDSLPFFLARFSLPGGLVLDPTAAIAVGLVTALVGTGIKESAMFQSIVTAGNIIILSAVVVIGLVVGTSAGWPGYSQMSQHGGYFPFGLSGTLGASAVVFYSYIGFDAVCTAAEEVKKPQKDLPVGIGLSLAICALLYMGVAAVLVGLVPFQDINPDIPMSDAFDRYNLPWAKFLVTGGALAALATTLLGSILPQPRILMAMARDGLLPGWFAKLNDSSGVPLNATVCTGLFAAAFAFFMDIEELSNMVSVGTLLAFSVVNLAVLILRYVPPHVPPPPVPPSVTESSASTFASNAMSFSSPRSSAMYITNPNSQSSVFGSSGGGTWRQACTTHMTSQSSLEPAAISAALPQALYNQLGSLDSIGNSPAVTLLTNEQLSMALKGPLYDSTPSTPEEGSSGSDGTGGVATSHGVSVEQDIPFEMSFQGRNSPDSDATDASKDSTDQAHKKTGEEGGRRGDSNTDTEDRSAFVERAYAAQMRAHAASVAAKLRSKTGAGTEAAGSSKSGDWVEALRSGQGKVVVQDSSGGGAKQGSTGTAKPAASGDWIEALRVSAQVPPIAEEPEKEQLFQQSRCESRDSLGAGQFKEVLQMKDQGWGEVMGRIDEDTDSEGETKRRRLAGLAVLGVAIGAPLLAASISVGAGTTTLGLRWVLWVLGLAVGGAFFFGSSATFLTLNQDQARHRFGSSGGFECPGVPLLPLSSYLVNSYLMVNLGTSTLIRSGIWLGLGAVVYITYGIHHSTLSEKRPVARVIRRSQRSQSWWQVLPWPDTHRYEAAATELS